MVPINPIEEVSKVLWEDFKENKIEYIKTIISLIFFVIYELIQWIFIKITHYRELPDSWKECGYK